MDQEIDHEVTDSQGMEQRTKGVKKGKKKIDLSVAQESICDTRNQSTQNKLRVKLLVHRSIHGLLTLVAILQLNSEAHGILDTVSAPRGSHAALHRTQRLTVGMPGLETGCSQFLPDSRQLHIVFGVQEMGAFRLSK